MMNGYKKSKSSKKLKRKYEALNPTRISMGKKQVKLSDLNSYKGLIKPCYVLVTKWDGNGSISHVEHTYSASNSYKTSQLHKTENCKSTWKNCITISDSDSSSETEVESNSSKTVKNAQNDSCENADNVALQSITPKIYSSHSEESDHILKKRQNLSNDICNINPCFVVLNKIDDDANGKRLRNKSKNVASDISCKETALHLHYTDQNHENHKPKIQNSTKLKYFNSKNSKAKKRASFEKEKVYFSSSDDESYAKSNSGYSSDIESDFYEIQQCGNHTNRKCINKLHCFDELASSASSSKLDVIQDSYTENKYILSTNKFPKFVEQQDSSSDTESEEKSSGRNCKFVNRKRYNLKHVYECRNKETEARSNDDIISKCSSIDLSESIEDNEKSCAENSSHSEHSNEDDYFSEQKEESVNKMKLSDGEDSANNAIAMDSECAVKILDSDNNHKSCHKNVRNVLQDQKETFKIIVQFRTDNRKEKNDKISSRMIFLPSSEDINSEKKFPLGDEPDIYFFRSQIGKKYTVDYFKFGNIKKIFVFLHLREKSNLSLKEHTKGEQNTRNDITVSEMGSLGTFNKKSNLILSRNINIRTNISSNRAAKKRNLDKYVFDIFPQKESCSTVNPCRDSDKSDFLSSNSDNEEPVSSKVFSGKRNFLSSNSGSEESVVSKVLSKSDKSLSSSTSESSESENEITGSTVGGYELYDRYCVHCQYEFVNKNDNYNHICLGKRKKGFLCRYCEAVLSLHKKFKAHMIMHLTPSDPFKIRSGERAFLNSNSDNEEPDVSKVLSKSDKRDFSSSSSSESSESENEITGNTNGGYELYDCYCVHCQ